MIRGVLLHWIGTGPHSMDFTVILMALDPPTFILVNHINIPTLIGMYIGLTSMGVLGILLGPIMIIALRSLIRADIFSDILPERSAFERKEDIAGKGRNS